MFLIDLIELTNKAKIKNQYGEIYETVKRKMKKEMKNLAKQGKSEFRYTFGFAEQCAFTHIKTYFENENFNVSESYVKNHRNGILHVLIITWEIK